jgi:hypothetical protein
VDFTLPRGLSSQVRTAVRENMIRLVRDIPKGVPYVFVSTTMAFGMAPQARSYRRHLISRTAYASQKRFGERLARRLGRRYGRPVYVLRLGQVHGEIQAGSRSLMSIVSSGRVRFDVGAETLSDAVFCSTIAMSLENIAYGLERPGTYTVLESPEWTWRQLYEFYQGQAEVPDRLLAAVPPQRGFAAEVVSAVKAKIARFAFANRELFTAHFLSRAQDFEERLRGPYLAKKAVAEVAAGQTMDLTTLHCYQGPVPGRRLDSLGRTRGRAEEVRLDLNRHLDAILGEEGHNFHFC